MYHSSVNTANVDQNPQALTTVVEASPTEEKDDIATSENVAYGQSTGLEALGVAAVQQEIQGASGEDVTDSVGIVMTDNAAYGNFKSSK